MSTSLRLLAFLATASLAILGGCKTGDSSGPDDDTTAEAPTQDPAEGGGMLATTEEDKLSAQRAETVVQSYVDKARLALDHGDLEAARNWLTHAFEVAPGNQRVRRMLNQVELQLGERSASIGDIKSSAADLDRVRRAQARLEVENKEAEADRLREAGDLDGALHALEDAALILRWNPYLLSGTDETGLTETQMRERISTLRRERDDRNRAAAAERERRALAEKAEREREERERAANTVTRFLARANDAFYRDRFKEAETYCNQVLDLDPSNGEAVELQRIAVKARHAALESQYRSDFKYHWREVFDKLEMDMHPVNDLLTFPDRKSWEAISSRGPIRFSLEQEVVSAEDQRIWEALATQTIELSFDETELEDAIQWFRINTGINFIVDPIVLDSGFDISFSFTLGSMSVKNALDLLMNFAGSDIDYRVRNGVVRIISTEDASGGQILEFYDVRDLTKTISSFPSRDFNLTPSNSFDDFEEEEIEPAPIVIDPDVLTDLINTNIAPDSWDADPANSINYISGALVVRQTPKVQRDIHKLLSDLRQNSGTLINVETRFIELEDRFLEDIGVDFRGLDGQNGAASAEPIPNVILDDFGTPGSGGVGSPGFPQGIGTSNDAGVFYTQIDQLDLRSRTENLYDLTLGDEEFRATGGLATEFTFIDDTLAQAVLRAVQKSTLAEIIHASNLTVFNGQRANIMVDEQVSYLRDFEVEIAQGAVIADPVVDIIRQGNVLDVRPVVSSDRRFVTMEVRPTLVQLMEPIQVFRTSLAIGNEVELQLPELEIQRVRTTVTIPDGSTLLLGGLKTLVDKRIESGVPFLRDIPILSFFFGRKGTEKTRRKTMILVRAQIVIPEEGEPTTSP